MTEESKASPNEKKSAQGSDQKESGDGSRSRRRYYRQRGKKKSDPSAGAAQTSGQGSGSEGKLGQDEAKPTGEGSGSSSSRRRRSSRANKAGGQSQKKDRSSSKRRSGSRNRRNRRSSSEPMVETGIQVPETPNYVEPEAVYVYEHLIRPAYRDASDYRPDSFSQQFDHSEAGVSQLHGQYVGLYHPQYPIEEHPEDAPYRREDAEPMLSPKEAIRAFFAENPEPDEETEPEVDPGPEA